MKIYPGRKMNRERIPNHPIPCTLTLCSHSLFLLHESLPLFESSLAPDQNELPFIVAQYILSTTVNVSRSEVCARADRRPTWCPQSNEGMNMSSQRRVTRKPIQISGIQICGKQKHSIVLSDKNVIQELQYLIISISALIQGSLLTKENVLQNIRPNKEDVAQ